MRLKRSYMKMRESWQSAWVGNSLVLYVSFNGMYQNLPDGLLYPVRAVDLVGSSSTEENPCLNSQHASLVLKNG